MVVVVVIVVIGLPFIVNSNGIGYIESQAYLDLACAVAAWLYFSVFESSRLQATPGKLALGIRVTDLEGNRIGFGRATGRFFSKIVSGLILDIGYIMAAFTSRKQALHDMMAGTLVIYVRGQQFEQSRETPIQGKESNF